MFNEGMWKASETDRVWIAIQITHAQQKVQYAA